MKNLASHLTFAALALLSCLSAPFLSAQTSPALKPATHKPATHKPATHKPMTGSTATPLPENIPPAPGIAKSLYALRYIDIKPGTGGAAMPGWLYTVHYTGWLYDGTKFDSSVDRGTPFEFAPVQHRVIAGWYTGFEGMKVGGKRRLFIPWQLAYGEQGRAPIPPKANLIFDIELLDQRDPNAPPPAPAPVPTPAPTSTEPSTTPSPGKATPPTPEGGKDTTKQPQPERL